jgi:hypothetical protein
LYGLRLSLIIVSLLPIIAAVSQESQPGAAETAPAPFTSGERLVYTLKWDPPWYMFFLPNMEAGEIDLHLVGETEYKNKKALKITLKARSSGSLAKLAGMKIEDDYVFYVEPGTFCTLAVSGKIKEGKRKRQIEVEYLRETGQLHFRETDDSVVPPKLLRDDIKNDIPSCVRDPFSALYSYRTLTISPDHDQKFVVGDNDKIKEIRCHAEKKEKIDTSAGKVFAWRVNTEALLGGLFKEGGQFMVWFSADEKKTPLQFEVNVKLGKVLGKLKPKK